MSDTITDMPKVTQMLDSGWIVRMYRNGMGSYEARAFHSNASIRDTVARKLIEGHESVPGQTLTYEADYDWTRKGWLITDDFTPEQALTRLAYKVHGEII